MKGIEVVGLAKRFGERTAVEALSFEVAPGEVFGLLGPNGAGKTTTVRMLAGLLEPTEGRAVVCGLDVRTAGEALRERVGLLTEQPGLYDRLTGRENLEFFIRLHELDRAAAWTRAEGYLERFGLAGRENDPCGAYSKGMRQKLAIVRAVLHQPEVIFLDEPTSGLDPEAARTVRDAVAELAREGRTIILCSHNLPEVERLCTRVAVIKRTLRAASSLSALREEGLALEVGLQQGEPRFQAAVEALPFHPHVLVDGTRLRVMLTSEEQAPDVVATLCAAGARIYSVHRQARPLEEVYLELVSEEEE